MSINDNEQARVHYLPGHEPDAFTEAFTGPSTQPIRVPAVRADQDGTGESGLDSPVLDGELVEPGQGPRSQKELALARYQGYRHDVVSTVRAVRTAATHDRTKAVVRHVVAYPVAGVGVVVRRWRDTHGANRYERQMRAAEAAGDQEGLRYWQEQDTAEKQRRHARVMDWVRAPGDLLKAAAIGLAGFLGLLLVLGVVLAFRSGDVTDVYGPVVAIVDAVAFLVWFFATYGVLLVCAGTVGTGFYLYRTGRDHAQVPAWLGGPVGETDQMDGLPDENTILNALHHMGMAGFNRAVKEGWRVKFVMPPTIDGKGYRAQLALPPACTVEEIVRKKTVLAHNLVRYPNEVWPTEPQPSMLDLWVAKPGALSGPVDPWPLLATLDTAQTDYFKGVPAGVTIKGDVVNGRLSEANHVYGGMMGSGKSTLAINHVCGAMLDPLVEIDVVVMAENADYEPMKPRLRSLTTGAGEETVDACMALLTSLYDDLSVRGKALREYDVRSVAELDRAVLANDPRLWPRLVVIDECQNLFMGKHGKDAIEIGAKLQSTARKYAITLMWLTPEPSKDACPRKITSTASHKACFAIGDQQANDAVLGTGSYKAGISAVGLTPKTDEGPGDIGTAMARGFTAKPGLLRSFYIAQKDVRKVVKRALDLREQGDIAKLPAAAAPVEVDHLADIAAVIGDQPRMRTQEVLAALTARDASTYRAWTFADLADALPDEAKPYKSSGVMVVARSRVAEALINRDFDTESDDEDGEM